MTSEQRSVADVEQIGTLPTHGLSRPNSPRAIGLALALFTLPLALFSLIQYYRYGFDLFLGWDTSTYVWWTELFYKGGVNYVTYIAYPNLYVIILAGFGLLIGQVSLAERILPFLVALPLGYACYRLTLDMTTDRRLAYLGALLGGLSINSLRLESDLHRNLLSFSLSLFLGAIVSSQLQRHPFSWRTDWKLALLVWLPLLAVIAYTQIETYLVLSLTLLIMFSLRRKVGAMLSATLLVSLPLILALPLIWPFLSGYRSSIGLIGLSAQPPLLVLATTFLFLGGFALPWTVVGLAATYNKARKGSQAALFVMSWLIVLVCLLPLAIVMGLPYDRFLYVIPVPIIVALGAKSILQAAPSSSRTDWLLNALTRFTQMVLRKRWWSLSLAVLLIAVLATSTTADTFLRPFVSRSDVNRLDYAAELLRQHGYAEPILVMYGPNASDLNAIYRAYFGINIPDNFAYYGKLQYLLTLPNPATVYTWQFDPAFEMASSIRDRTEILTRLGAVSAIASHPIVIAGGDTYDRPLSEIFIQQFETSPGSGVYIIPPNQLQANQIDYWHLYAYSDWTNRTRASVNSTTWAQAQQVLDYVAKGATAHFQANYSISLAQSWSWMQFTLRFYDWQQPFIFPDTSNATLAPLQIKFDNQLLLNYTYTGQGPRTITATLQNISSGVHTITISSTSNAPATAVAIALDTIQVCPLRCT